MWGVASAMLWVSGRESFGRHYRSGGTPKEGSKEYQKAEYKRSCGFGDASFPMYVDELCTNFDIIYTRFQFSRFSVFRDFWFFTFSVFRDFDFSRFCFSTMRIVYLHKNKSLSEFVNTRPCIDLIHSLRHHGFAKGIKSMHGSHQFPSK